MDRLTERNPLWIDDEMWEEVQRYRALEKRLTDMFGSSLSLETVVDELERQLKEPGKPHPINAKILTYEDAADWDVYRAIGTPEELQEMKKDFAEALSDWRQYRKVGTLEECRAAVEKQMARKPLIGTNMMTKKKYKVCPKCGDNLINTDYLYFYCDMCGQKLDWCPLRELPEKSDHPEHCDNGRFDAGWNACLDEILGGKDDGTTV